MLNQYEITNPSTGVTLFVRYSMNKILDSVHQNILPSGKSDMYFTKAFLHYSSVF